VNGEALAAGELVLIRSLESFEPTPGILIGALVRAGSTGVIGGASPAIRAVRVSPAAAIRE
jgi:hypothetical protein